ncbi:MAG TPA: hypothetical protein VJ822_15590 [Dongiaceae bacterium]|nr:hypothetical protein [Dongiaceae bacterium]
MSRHTRRMIERLDPFGLPQQAADRLALEPAVPKVQENGDTSDKPCPPRVPRQRGAKAPRRK